MPLPVLACCTMRCMTGSGIKSNGSVGRWTIHQCKTKIKKGVIIEKIDGEAITNDMDWTKLLNRKAGKNTLLSLYDPETKTTMG